MPNLRPEDMIIGSLGQDFLGRVKALVVDPSAIQKGDAVLVTSLSFDSAAQKTPRAGAVRRSDATPSGYVLIAANAAPVGKQVVTVKWLPLPFDTTGQGQGTPLYIDDDGSPTFTVKTVIIGRVVNGNATIENGGSVILEAPGLVG